MKYSNMQTKCQPQDLSKHPCEMRHCLLTSNNGTRPYRLHSLWKGDISALEESKE